MNSMTSYDLFTISYLIEGEKHLFENVINYFIFIVSMCDQIFFFFFFCSSFFLSIISSSFCLKYLYIHTHIDNSDNRNLTKICHQWRLADFSRIHHQSLSYLIFLMKYYLKIPSSTMMKPSLDHLQLLIFSIKSFFHS